MDEAFDPAVAARDAAGAVHDAADAAHAQADATSALAAQIGELAVVLRQMQTVTHRTDRRGRWTTLVGAAVAVLLGAGSAITIGGMNERDDRAKAVAEILEAIHANQETIKGCTSPGYECYDTNQARSNARLAPMFAVLCATLEPADRKPPCPAE